MAFVFILHSDPITHTSEINDIKPWFLNPDQTSQYDWVNHEPVINLVQLVMKNAAARI